MRYFLSAIWACLAVGWLSGISVIARLIGGYKYIEHMGQTRTVLMLSLMAAGCLVAAIVLAVWRRLPALLSWCVGAVAGVHLFNAFGLLILSNAIGHVSPLVMLLFGLVSLAVPTTTQFAGMPPGNASLLLLPVVTLLILSISVATGRVSPTAASTT